MSAHIPDAYEKTTLFYGWYSNRWTELATKPFFDDLPVGDVSP